MLGAVCHELSHMPIPAAFGADISLAWRDGVAVGGPSVVVKAAEPLPRWAHVLTAVSPAVWLAIYAVAAWVGIVPARPWEFDTTADGAAAAFLLVVLPSPEDVLAVIDVLLG